MEDQIKLGMMFLGITSIVALVGLILMFTIPGISQLSIGQSYTYNTNRGIAEPYKLPPNYYPYMQYPSYEGERESLGTRQPVIKLFVVGQGNIAYDASYCWAEMYPVFSNPEEKLSCYTIPTMGVEEEAKGFYYTRSSARDGDEVWCYLRDMYIEPQFKEKMKNVVGNRWTEKNGIFECNLEDFRFPQGSKYY